MKRLFLGLSFLSSVSAFAYDIPGKVLLKNDGNYNNRIVVQGDVANRLYNDMDRLVETFRTDSGDLYRHGKSYSCKKSVSEAVECTIQIESDTGSIIR